MGIHRRRVHLRELSFDESSGLFGLSLEHGCCTHSPFIFRPLTLGIQAAGGFVAHAVSVVPRFGRPLIGTLARTTSRMRGRFLALRLTALV